MINIIVLLDLLFQVVAYTPPWNTKAECLKPRAIFDPDTKFVGYDATNNMKVLGKLEYMKCDFSHNGQWGQAAEDAVIYKRYFKNANFMGNGIFLEMGGLDGWKFSNTFMFEQCLGWNGMLIEAQPDNYKKMIAHRPCTQNVWSAACPTNQGHLFMSRHDGVSAASSSETANVDMVPCRPLSAIFDEHHVTVIDFFSLDVEGHEANVLETVDFTRVHFGVIIAELERLGMDKGSAVASAKNQRVHDILTGAGMMKAPAAKDVPQCWRDIKSAEDIHGSAIYIHPTLRDDICPDAIPGGVNAWFEFRTNATKHRHNLRRGHTGGHKSHLNRGPTVLSQNV